MARIVADHYIAKELYQILRNGSQIPRQMQLSILKSVSEALSMEQQSKTARMEYLLENLLRKTHRLMERQMFPGFATSFRIDNQVTVELVAGYTSDEKNKKIDVTTQFDLASITKLFTNLLIFDLVTKEKLNLTDTIKNLNQEFNLDITILDLLRFSYELQTPERLDVKDELGRFIHNKESAVTLLKQTKVIEKIYKYNDIGHMILSEIIPSFEKELLLLVQKRYHMEGITFHPDEGNATGSYPEHLHIVHDPKARVMGGVSGHSGLYASSSELLKLYPVLAKLPKPYMKHMTEIRNAEQLDAYENHRGMVYVKHPNGLKMSAVPREATTGSIAVSGTTGTWALFDFLGGYTVNYLTNPFSGKDGKRSSDFMEIMDQYKLTLLETIWKIIVYRKLDTGKEKNLPIYIKKRL